MRETMQETWRPLVSAWRDEVADTGHRVIEMSQVVDLKAADLQYPPKVFGTAGRWQLIVIVSSACISDACKLVYVKG